MDCFSLFSIARNGQLLGMAQKRFEECAKSNFNIKEFGFMASPEPSDFNKPLPFERVFISSPKAMRLLAEAMKVELEAVSERVKEIAAEDAPYGGVKLGLQPSDFVEF